MLHLQTGQCCTNTLLKLQECRGAAVVSSGSCHSPHILSVLPELKLMYGQPGWMAQAEWALYAVLVLARTELLSAAARRGRGWDPKVILYHYSYHLISLWGWEEGSLFQGKGIPSVWVSMEQWDNASSKLEGKVRVAWLQSGQALWWAFGKSITPLSYTFY